MKVILDGSVEVNPENYLETNFAIDLRERRRLLLEPTNQVMTFFGDDMQYILNHVATYSRAQGMPLTIDFEDPDNTILEYYIDFTADSYEVGSDFVNVQIVRRKSLDHFFRLAEGKSLSVVNYPSAVHRYIDYQIIQPQQGLTYISLTLAFLSLQQELAQSIKDVQESIADVQEASTPSVSAAGPVVNVGAIIAASIKLAARVAYAIFIVAALINVITDILKLIFPPVRQFKCLRLRDLVKSMIEDLGFFYESSLLDSLDGATIIPVPVRKKDPIWLREVFFPQSLAYNDFYPTNRDTIKTGADVIDFVERTFNAETMVQNGVVRIERRSFWFENANQNVTANFNVMPDETTLVTYSNTMWKRKLFSYSIDANDINTLDDQNGTIDEYNASLMNSPNPDIVTLKDFEDVNISMSRATKKGDLTAVEIFAKTLASAVDFFAGTNFVQQIQSRENIMVVSDQYFTVTKFAWCVDSRLHPNQNQFIGTETIWNEYHRDKDPENNELEITAGMPIGLKLSEVISIQQNNYVNLDGRVVRVNYIEINPDDRDAIIDFEERKNITNIKTERI